MVWRSRRPLAQVGARTTEPNPRANPLTTAVARAPTRAQALSHASLTVISEIIRISVKRNDEVATQQ